ncbi:MAG: four helix bundle protein [Phycisphaerales bacterium]
MQDCRKLAVRQNAHALTLRIYRCSERYPKDEFYGLTSQVRRAGGSIGANIVEGCGRGTGRDQLRLFQIATGLIDETEYLLLLARDVKYIGATAQGELAGSPSEVMAMHRTLLRLLRERVERVSAGSTG